MCLHSLHMLIFSLGTRGYTVSSDNKNFSFQLGLSLSKKRPVN